MTDLTDAKDAAEKFLVTKKLELAAQNLKHYTKIAEEQVTIDAIVSALQDTQDKAQNSNPKDFSALLGQQSQILDATFQFFMDNAKEAYTGGDKIAMALKAQRQMVSTINTWCALEKIKKTEKQTEQDGEKNAPLER